MRTQVAIIGAGPSGLLLSQLLHGIGIESIVLERQSRDHVLSRIRAGILERGFLELMRKAGVDARLTKESFRHSGTLISFANQSFRVDFQELTGHSVTVYGQTEVTRDLYEAADNRDTQVFFEVEDVDLVEINSDAPKVCFRHQGQMHEIKCDFIAGCDGFHGVSRKAIPTNNRREFEKTYPFGWLGILSETPPVNEELIYSNSPEGFALCSMRNENLSRYYVQCSLKDRPDDWSDDAFWQALKRRIPEETAERLVTGPSIEKSIAPLRSFVCEPMRWGRLFLCGDAAHIVPPTGAKGLNTAASDIHYLFNGLCQFYQHADSAGLDQYSTQALARVWKAERFSWWFSSLLHQFPDATDFDHKMQIAELEYLQSDRAAQTAFANNYVGLPY